MRRFVILAVGALVAVGAVAPGALAKGKPPKSGTGCKPRVQVVLQGTATATDATAGTLTFTVAGSNKHGRTLVGESFTVAVTSDTTVKRNGSATLADILLAPADRVMVKLRWCKADLASLATPTAPPAAAKVVAKPAKPAEPAAP
ncbi:MAG: hypothetical protein R3C15_01925 [Thermoleophilia bacterium]